MEPTDNDAKTNLRIIVICKKIRRQHNGIKILFTEMEENSPNIWKEINIRISEAHRTPNTHDQKKEPLHATLYSKNQKSNTGTKSQKPLEKGNVSHTKVNPSDCSRLLYRNFKRSGGLEVKCFKP